MFIHNLSLSLSLARSLLVGSAPLPNRIYCISHSKEYIYKRSPETCALERDGAINIEQNCVVFCIYFTIIQWLLSTLWWSGVRRRGSDADAGVTHLFNHRHTHSPTHSPIQEVHKQTPNNPLSTVTMMQSDKMLHVLCLHKYTAHGQRWRISRTSSIQYRLALAEV